MATSSDGQQLIVVSNRLPFVFRQNEQGEWQMAPGSGGLITALLPVLKSRGGVWIGWPGAAVDAEALALPALGAEAGYQVKPVELTQDEAQRFYLGFSNEIIWPLFHDLQSLCNFDPSYWEAYRSANVKYAQTIADTAEAGDLVWVHDYHLINVAREARAKGVTSRMAFFLHIPFPSPDIFLKLPWRFELLHAAPDSSARYLRVGGRIPGCCLGEAGQCCRCAARISTAAKIERIMRRGVAAPAATPRKADYSNTMVEIEAGGSATVSVPRLLNRLLTAAGLSINL